jgi:hypothetical protein
VSNVVSAPQVEEAKIDSEEDTACVTVISVSHGKDTVSQREEPQTNQCTLISVAHTTNTDLPLEISNIPRHTSRTEIVIGADRSKTQLVSESIPTPISSSFQQKESHSNKNSPETMTVTQVSFFILFL